MTTAPKIRHETAFDQQAVFRVNKAAFGRDEEAELVDALRDGGKYVLSLVAEIDGEIVGHALYTPLRVESESRAAMFVALGPLAVAPEWRRQGIGTRLMETAHEELRAIGETAVFLLGHVSYYRRLGFRPAREFDVHYEDDRDSFMALELEAGALAEVSGRAVFAEEFSRFT